MTISVRTCTDVFDLDLQIASDAVCNCESVSPAAPRLLLFVIVSWCHLMCRVCRCLYCTTSHCCVQETVVNSAVLRWLISNAVDVASSRSTAAVHVRPFTGRLADTKPRVLVAVLAVVVVGKKYE